MSSNMDTLLRHHRSRACGASDRPVLIHQVVVQVERRWLNLGSRRFPEDFTVPYVKPRLSHVSSHYRRCFGLYVGPVGMAHTVTKISTSVLATHSGRNASMPIHTESEVRNRIMIVDSMTRHTQRGSSLAAVVFADIDCTYRRPPRWPSFTI